MTTIRFQAWSRMIVGGLALCVCALLAVSLARAGKPGGGGGGGSPPPPVGFRFLMVNLGSLGGGWSVANGMNNLGDVVGLSGRSDGSAAPFVYFASTAQMQDVNSLIENPLDNPAEPVFGPDRNNDGVSDLHVVSRGTSSGGAGSVSIFDGVDGEFLGYFIAPGAGGLTTPAFLCIGPDGHFYLPSRGAGATSPPRTRVLKFDGDTGAPLGEFVSPGSGGLGLVHALAFGTDLDGDTKPDLFVTSDEEVFAYSGDDGAPLGVFVAPGTGGLQRPLDLLFVPDLDADDVSDLLLGTNSFDGTGEGVVLALSGVDGSFIREFTPRVDNTVIRFNQMDLGPDGALYIIDTLGDQVLRYDAAADEFEAFVPSGSGGLGEATPFLAFDPEGDLYVSNENQREVLKYEGPLAGEPGAFIGVFAHGSRWIISEVRDINDSQQIVGWGYPQGALGDMTPGAFLLTPPAAGGLFGTITSLGGPAGSDVRPEAINNNGDVAGSYNVGGAHAAFLSTPEDEFVDLGQLNGTNTFAHDLSDRHAAGQVTIVGEWAAHEQAWRAVCTPGAIGGAVPLLQLGSLFSDRRTPGSSSVFGVNNAGQIVGFTTTGRNDTRAARYTASGGWVSLGTLAPSTASSWNDSEAQAINDAGYTVGQSMVGDVNAVPNIRAFIHADGIGIRDLASLVDDLSPADAGELGLPAAINNSRLICGPFVTNYTDVETKEAYVLLPYTVP